MFMNECIDSTIGRIHVCLLCCLLVTIRGLVGLSMMWWKQHQQEFPDLARMTRQYLTVPVTSVSPERFFSRVGLVQTDFALETSGHHHD